MKLYVLSAGLALLLEPCFSSDKDRPPVPDVLSHDFTTPLGDGSASCGVGIYPCGPYGTKVNDIARNLEFLGFMDPTNHCKEHKDKVQDMSKLQKISFADWHLGSSDPACAKYTKKLLWVMVSAGWCGPCQTEVQQTQTQYENGWVPKEVGILNVIFETAAPSIKPADEAFIKTWTTSFKLTFPVVMDPSFKMGAYFNRSATPFNMLVDTSNMKIYYEQVGSSLSTIGKKVNEFLGK